MELITIYKALTLILVIYLEGIRRFFLLVLFTVLKFCRVSGAGLKLNRLAFNMCLLCRDLHNFLSFHVAKCNLGKVNLKAMLFSWMQKACPAASATVGTIHDAYTQSLPYAGA